MSEDRLSVEAIAKQMRSNLERAAPAGQSTVDRVVYVLGEPAVLFQLYAAGEQIVKPAQAVVTASAMFEDRAVPTFLVIGPQSDGNAAIAADWFDARSHWKLVAEYDYRPSRIVWLDLHDPRAAVERRTTHHSLRLYQFQSAERGGRSAEQ